MVKDTTLYDELEVPPNSTTNDIRKAYRKLSLKWHPDKNPDNKDEATVKFQKISEAFAILNDDDKRSKYDQFGDDFLKNQSGGGGHGINPEDLFTIEKNQVKINFFMNHNKINGKPNKDKTNDDNNNDKKPDIPMH